MKPEHLDICEPQCKLLGLLDTSHKYCVESTGMYFM